MSLKMDDRFYVSQYEQDRVFEKLCYPNGDESHNGIFLDVGAWDGVDISNTYMLEKKRDWRGLLIEPIPNKAEEAKHNRWSPVWNGCIWNKNGSTLFNHVQGYSEMLSSILNGIHPRHKERIDKDVIEHKQTTELINIPCMTLNEVMKVHNIKQADFLSLDVQTAELSVLQAYDPVKNPIKVIVLDTNGVNNDELSQWFKSAGYSLHWKSPRADEYMWVNPSFSWSWCSVT
jgi:FkbM family methyltransferase